MRVTVIDETTGEIYAVEPPARATAARLPVTFDSETPPLAFDCERAFEQASAWQPLTFRDGRIIEVNAESGEIAGQ